MDRTDGRGATIGFRDYSHPVFELFSGWAELQFSWIGIIGVVLPAAALAYAFIIKRTNRAKYEVMGRFVNEGA